jgi:hypothetical protein
VLDDLRALAYLDARLMANRLRLLARDPKRLVPWLLLLGWLAVTRLLRFASGGGGGGPARPAPTSFLLPLVALLPGAYLTLMGARLLAASRRPPATFRTAADAHFLIGSHISPRLVVGWLQVRKVIGGLMASLINVLVLVAFVPWLSAQPTHLEVLLLALVGAYVTLLTVPMSAHFLSRRIPWLPLASLGAAVTAVGVTSAAVGLLTDVGVALPGPTWVRAVLLHAPPGQWVVDAYNGQALAALPMLALAIVAIILTVRLSADCYPELWESSTRVMALTRLARDRRGMWVSRSDLRRALGQVRRRSAASRSGSWVPAGAWAILWKEWLTLRRSSSSSVLAVFVVGALVAGFVAGTVALSGHRALVSSIYSTAAALLLLANLYAGIQLGSELRRPVWWLSAATLKMRLLAWTVAGSLPMAVVACAAFGTALARSDEYPLVVPVLLAIPAATWTMRMAAVASYVLFPSQLDVRGPGRAMRALVLWACVAPAALTLILILIVTDSLPGAIAATVPTMLVEGWLLLEFSAWLVRRNGLSYARAQSR